MTTRMAHPNLPDQDITVADSAVPFHRAAGWEVVPDEPEPPPPEPDQDQAPEKDSGAFSFEGAESEEESER